MAYKISVNAKIKGNTQQYTTITCRFGCGSGSGLKQLFKDSSPLVDRIKFAIKVHHNVKRALWWKHHICVIASEGLSSLIALFIWCDTDDIIVEDDNDTDDDDMYPGRCVRMNFDSHYGNAGGTGSGSPQSGRYRKNTRHDSQRSRDHYQRYYRRQPHQTQTRGSNSVSSVAPPDMTRSDNSIPCIRVSPPGDLDVLLPGGTAWSSERSSKSRYIWLLFLM